MSDQGQKTEKPTKRRLDKARKEGNFPSSREFLSGVQFIVFVVMAVSFSGSLLIRTARLMRVLLARAFTMDMTPGNLTALTKDVVVPEFVPLILAGGVLVLAAVCAQLATTGLGISASKLAPDIQRLNVLKKLSSLPGQNLPMLIQALLLLPVVGLVVYYETAENLDQILALAWMTPQASVASVAGIVEKLLWRAAGLFAIVGIGDLIWQRSRYARQLRMSKHEIREESKEQEGSPHIKMRIRRMQRDLSRRQMMKEVQNATAVIVNPTHFAVAIRYSVDSTGAPKVVAKGKNYLAARIRKRALEHQIPIVENPPLAQALYKTVDVGQEIPPHLYRAVAEILAYIYKLMNGRLPG